MADRLLLPPGSRGLRVGLFGGSFNPPHRAHRAASLLALRRLGLDQVWWLVTPGNPLKSTGELAPLAARVSAARALAAHPRIVVTDAEAGLGTRYTCDTIAAIARRRPGVRFVWIMGADNLAQFHRWRRWRLIAATCPIAVVDRPGQSFRALVAPAALALARARRREADAGALATADPPAWVFLHGLKSRLSSTQLRKSRATD